MIRAGVLGATGYTGVELVRLLATHPDVRVEVLASESHAGRPMGEVYPSVGPLAEKVLEPLEAAAAAARCDVVFLALPHGLGARLAPVCLQAGARVVDLGADFRLRDPDQYRNWYGGEPPDPEWLSQAVYGLPELFGEAVAGARLVANPGCYPTAVLLGLAPLLSGGWLAPDPVVIDAKSGVSGAGRGLSLKVHFGEINENLRPYDVAGRHRHTPEIEQACAWLAGRPVRVSFNPHLVPMTRGIVETIYCRLARPASAAELYERYASFYDGAPFVRVLPPGVAPQAKFALGSNTCFVGVEVDERAGLAVVVAALDNLVKGAAGQAVQNMNRMFGLDETKGLPLAGMYP
ncbi:MAG: N-acetyl-gamma-glutamyl-phosphate reductase [Clostridia bacterium]|nr:N-acetyl-gamma-glutamyl-phosphate reductase [Clostridia bacterium]